MRFQYVYVEPGLPSELAYITLDEVVKHLDNYLNNFLLDPNVCICYINRLLHDKKINSNQTALNRLIYLLRKMIQFQPFNVSLLKLFYDLTQDRKVLPGLIILKKLKKLSLLDSIDHYRLTNRINKAFNLLKKGLQDNPENILLAYKGLELEYQLGKGPGDWLDCFDCPDALLNLWRVVLFEHYARLNLVDEASELWPLIKTEDLTETTLNLAAEIAIKAGNKDEGISLYQKSLAIDPLQKPVASRLQQLISPLIINNDFLYRKKVSIYLYTYNKAQFLQATLAALADTEIGNSEITVLLNGCTDDSKQVIKTCKELFLSDLNIIELPVNIGAPAARNWLIARDETWQSDYIAFLDDDITMPENWLTTFLSVAETDPQAAVIGGKILFPGKPHRYQYLYRNLAIVRQDLIRTSFATPNNQFDNNLYDFVCDTWNVMGCCHLLRTTALKDVPWFDIRFSPSQMDDIAHDFELKLKGYNIKYCGLVSIIHHQNSGVNINILDQDDYNRTGNVLGNDVKFFYKFAKLLYESPAKRDFLQATQ